MIPCIRFAALLAAAASVVYHEVSAADHLRQNDLSSLEREIDKNSRNLADTVPEYNQDIRGGFEVTDAIPWYLVFTDTTVSGGALLSEPWKPIIRF